MTRRGRPCRRDGVSVSPCAPSSGEGVRVEGSPHAQYPPLSSVYISERSKILILEQAMSEQDRRIAETIERERGRLRNFIRKRVADREDVEDVLQDVFFELVEAYRLMKPIEQVGAWLFRVARNRMIDRFRKKRPEASNATRPSAAEEEDGDAGSLEDLLPSPDAGPEAAYARGVLLDELEAALGELPEEQRFVFVAHELEGKSFRELASETGVSVNTLLSRKHYAVLHLRRRLQNIYDEFKKSEDESHGTQEKASPPETDRICPAELPGPFRWPGLGGLCALELADADHLWAAHDHVLASPRLDGAVLDPLPRLSRPAHGSRAVAIRLAKAMGRMTPPSAMSSSRACAAGAADGIFRIAGE